MSDTLTEVTPPDQITEPAKVAHIVKTEPGEDAAAKVLEARIYGYAIEALCGEVFVPQRDPTKLPVCEPCKEIYDMYRMVGDGSLPQQPRH